MLSLKRLVPFALAAAATVGVSLLTATPASAANTSAFKVCTDANFSGTCFTFSSNANDLSNPARLFPNGFNDQISSIANQGNVPVCIYNDANFTGRNLLVGGGLQSGNLAGSAFQDSISSILFNFSGSSTCPSN
jgi:hypothetical protein